VIGRLRRIRSRVRTRLGISEAKVRDLDAEQAYLRVVIAGIVVGYAAAVHVAGTPSVGLNLALGAAASALAAGVWMLWWFRHHKHRPRPMRYFGIAADLVPLTIGLSGSGEAGVPLIGVYLWVTIGNGFRFGARYLLVAYWISLGCFALLLLFVPYWQAHQAIGVGFGVVLAVVPLYVLVLLSRLTAQKDAAEQLSNAKSRFVANVSHELRSPLTGVYGVYELLKQCRLPARERELIAMLGNSMATLKSAVDAVLQMSKLEAGAERAEMKLFNLRHFLLHMAAVAKPQATAKKLAWHLDVDVAIPTVVLGDSRHLRHVLGNLLHNACKFTVSGSVTLRARSAGSGRVRFEVQDTGIGIPVAAQERLFERFVQVDASARRRYGGTGLGTSIAHDLVKLMGGSIGVKSAPGTGSTFWVELPLAETSRGGAPEWGSLTHVTCLGYQSDCLDRLVQTITKAGLSVSVRSIVPNAEIVDDEGAQLLAVLVQLPASEAATLAQKTSLAERSAIAPWVVLADSYSGIERAVLTRLGAASLLKKEPSEVDLLCTLSALANRLVASDGEDGPDSIDTSLTQSLEIVLADDNASNRLLLARILENAGHHVQEASRGDQAYDLMLEKTTDLAILDLNMPDMTGPDVIKLYRAGEVGATKRLPILVLSADATPAAREESMAAGASEFLTKPVTAQTLLAAIHRLVGGRTSNDEQTSKVQPFEAAHPGGNRAQTTMAAPIDLQEPRDSHVPASAIIDTDRLNSLRKMANFDQRFLESYVTAAIGDLEQAVSELRVAVPSKNAVLARSALHNIDGTAATVGAAALAASARHLRQRMFENQPREVQQALAELESNMTLTRLAIRGSIVSMQTKQA
jgi:two-component system sensor histidine kinase RpfC